ncbi:MAG: hypothetical protein JST68_07085, partial [Bacteroidetes bacterium]|nr:hypothetical protein [Bacteroidota bacterium]
NLRHLQKERQRLYNRRITQENKLRSDWQDLRNSFSPSGLARHLVAAGAGWFKQILK